MQIVFIPYVANKTKSPTLQLNGGEVIPIRMRWYTNKGTNENAPEATTNVEVGSLMRGVPYTMTFCGKYWLVDSQITSPSFDNITRGTLQSVANGFIGASGTNKFAVPINKRNGVIGNAMISTTDAEKESNSINLVSEGKVSEMIRKDVTAEWDAYITNDSGGAPADFAQTLSDGVYFFECADESIYLRFKAYASVTTERFLGEERKMTFMRILYEDGVNYLYAFLNGKKLIETELDLNGSSEIRLLREGHSYGVLTSKNIPLPTSADDGTYLGCKNGAATWMPVEASGGGAGNSDPPLLVDYTVPEGSTAKILEFNESDSGIEFDLANRCYFVVDATFPDTKGKVVGITSNGDVQGAGPFSPPNLNVSVQEIHIFGKYTRDFENRYTAWTQYRPNVNTGYSTASGTQFGASSLALLIEHTRGTSVKKLVFHTLGSGDTIYWGAGTRIRIWGD